jgi:ribosomal protein L7/L12
MDNLKLMAIAKQIGLKGFGSMTTDEVREAVRTAYKQHQRMQTGIIDGTVVTDPEPTQKAIPAQDLESEIKALLRNGGGVPQKIQAIKLYRTRTGAGLVEAKRRVEEIEEAMDGGGVRAAVMPNINPNEPDWARKMTQERLKVELEKCDHKQYDQARTANWTRKRVVEELLAIGYGG